jgi:hypothetical protein
VRSLGKRTYLNQVNRLAKKYNYQKLIDIFVQETENNRASALSNPIGRTNKNNSRFKELFLFVSS